MPTVGGGDAGFAPDAFGEGGLIAGADGHLRAVSILPPEETSIRSVPSALSSRASSTDCSTSQPPSLQSRGGDAHEERAAVGQHLADGGHGLAQETGAVLEAAAIFVAARSC